MLSLRHENNKMTLFASPLFALIKIPTGFEDLLEGLAREILRRQPENIPLYAAHYCDFLIQLRMKDDNVQPEPSPNKIIVADSYFFPVQEPDVELPIRYLLQKEKFVPVNLDVYEKTALQTHEKVEQTDNNEFEKSIVKESVIEEGGKRKSLRSIGTQITLIVEDFTDTQNTEVNERKEFNVQEYPKDDRIIEKIQTQLSNDTVESSTEYTTTQSSETFSESVTDGKVVGSSPSSSSETFSETIQDQVSQDELDKTLETFENGVDNISKKIEENGNSEELVTKNDEIVIKLNANDEIIAETSPETDEKSISNALPEEDIIANDIADPPFVEETVPGESMPEVFVENSAQEIPVKQTFSDAVINIEDSMPTTDNDFASQTDTEETSQVTNESQTSEVPNNKNETVVDETNEESSSDTIVKEAYLEEESPEIPIQLTGQSIEISAEELFPIESIDSIPDAITLEETNDTELEIASEIALDEVGIQKSADEKVEDLDEIEELKKLIAEGNSEELAKAATKLQSNFRGFKSRKNINTSKENIEVLNENTSKSEEEIEIEELKKLIAEGNTEELAKAATKLQSNFRGFKSRKNINTSKENTSKSEEEIEIEELKKLIAEGDTEELSKAATKLQSNFRGFKSRKEMNPSISTDTSPKENKEKTEEEIEIEELQKLIAEGDTEELSKAATKLQSNFRGFKTRKEMKSQNSNETKEHTESPNEELGIEELKKLIAESPNEELEMEELKKLIAEGDTEELSKAATKLQSNFRGFKTRKEMKSQNSNETKETPDEELEIEELKKLIAEGDTEELSKAATKLQSNFMGFKTRKEINPLTKVTEENTLEAQKTVEELEIEELQNLIAEGNTEELSKAATKLQSNFRGFKTRKEMKSQNSNETKEPTENPTEELEIEELKKLIAEGDTEESEIEELKKLIAEGDTEELSKAATKLQSNFRGFKARKDNISVKLLNSSEELQSIDSTDTENTIIESNPDQITQEITKLQNEFQQIADQKQSTLILQFADTEDNCFKELTEIKTEPKDPSTYTIKTEGDEMPENTEKNTRKIIDGRESVELLQMAEEIVENVMEEAYRASSVMSLLNDDEMSERQKSVESDTPISDIIEIVIDVVDYLMETIAAEFDKKVDIEAAEVVEDLVSAVSLRVDGEDLDPAVLDVMEELIARVVESSKSRNVFPENGGRLEVAFVDTQDELQQFSTENQTGEPLAAIEEENQDINKQENAESDKEESLIFEPDDDQSVVALEEVVAAPPNSPALIRPDEDVGRSVSPDSLDQTLVAFTPDSLAEPTQREPLFTPDSIAEETEPQ